jgi:excisionase family DNA binding protein
MTATMKEKPLAYKPSVKDLVSLQQAAEILGCSVTTVRRRISDGTIRGFRVGPRLIKVDSKDLEYSFTRIPAARYKGGNR